MNYANHTDIDRITKSVWKCFIARISKRIENLRAVVAHCERTLSRIRDSVASFVHTTGHHTFVVTCIRRFRPRISRERETYLPKGQLVMVDRKVRLRHVFEEVGKVVMHLGIVGQRPQTRSETRRFEVRRDGLPRPRHDPVLSSASSSRIYVTYVSRARAQPMNSSLPSEFVSSEFANAIALAPRQPPPYLSRKRDARLVNGRIFA